MDEETHQYSDLLPSELNVLEGEYQIDAPFEVQCTETAVLGDIFHAGISLDSAFGDADYTVLGTDHCFVEWGVIHRIQTHRRMPRRRSCGPVDDRLRHVIAEPGGGRGRPIETGQATFIRFGKER